MKKTYDNYKTINVQLYGSQAFGEVSLYLDHVHCFIYISTFFVVI